MTFLIPHVFLFFICSAGLFSVSFLGLSSDYTGRQCLRLWMRPCSWTERLKGILVWTHQEEEMTSSGGHNVPKSAEVAPWLQEAAGLAESCHIQEQGMYRCIQQESSSLCTESAIHTRTQTTLIILNSFVCLIFPVHAVTLSQAYVSILKREES